MATTAELHSRLDDFWSIIKGLESTSLEDEFAKLGNYIAPNATIYFSGVGKPPMKGVDGAIADMKALVQFWGLVERQALVPAASADGKNLVMEIELPETEVVEFDGDGLIVRY